MRKPNLEMHFTANLAFADYLDQLKETIDMPVIRNWTNQEQILPIALKPFEINSSLMQVPKMLKEYVNQYKEKWNYWIYKRKPLKKNRVSKNSKFSIILSQVL